MNQRIGILGGTFDPFHNGHLAIARAALDQGRLDTVLFAVAGQPPHKLGAPLASPEDRYAMVQAAVADEPRFQATRVDMDREGPSYTADTVHLLRRQYPGAQFFLILGMDTLADLPGWRNPEGVLREAHILAAPRPGVYEVPETLRGHYDVLCLPEQRVSSTGIRERLEQGEGLDNLVPEAVERYIFEKGLYDTGAPA